MQGKYLLGVDIGSSSVKVALLEIATGKPLYSAYSPAIEMKIISGATGYAEQEPEDWWNELINAMSILKSRSSYSPDEIAAVGISYQMHGLVCIDKQKNTIRPSIIWCDSRAVETGDAAFKNLGEAYCLKHLLNSPGNFTASKLRWVQKNELELYQKIDKIMLPGDYIAMRMTGTAATTISGLSEAVLWDFQENKISDSLLEHYEIDKKLLPPLVPVFGEQGTVHKEAAAVLQIREGIPVSYRAGDQPNNAWSLNVLEPGEIAATAGTSGVVYGIANEPVFDERSRVNAFVHVNHHADKPRYGILMCINGTGSLNSWLRKTIFSAMSYEDINALAATVAAGSAGLQFYPFGNGAERILENREPGSKLRGLRFNTHEAGHLARAAQEGIVYAFNYGMGIMRSMGVDISTIRAGEANMFLSEIFCSALASLSGSVIELYNTDGAIGAARAAGYGAGIFGSYEESFRGMEIRKTIEPDPELADIYQDLYGKWLPGI